MPARSGAVSRSARVCVRVCRGGAARRGTPRRARRHRLARAARAAPSAWQPFAADGNDGGRRANGRRVAARVPRRRAARRRRMVLGAARPAGASQPFLPACFLIDTAPHISRARCCSSEAWRLAKPSQTDSWRCFLSRWALRVPRALDVQQRCGGPFLGCCGGRRIKPPSGLGGRIPLRAHMTWELGRFARSRKPETVSTPKQVLAASAPA